MVASIDNVNSVVEHKVFILDLEHKAGPSYPQTLLRRIPYGLLKGVGIFRLIVMSNLPIQSVVISKSFVKNLPQTNTCPI